ncbi:sterol glucosyltransferase [Coniochaeta sp. PMI_546]|nr:sterol glucosyltransferase [Coniochaeta sp. PMI_546]
MTGSREAEDFWGRGEADDLPAYTASIAQGLTQNGVETSDGRVDIDLDSRLARTLSRFVPDWKAPQSADSQDGSPAFEGQAPPAYTEVRVSRDAAEQSIPPLNIVVQVVGSRGDVQPFIALGNELQRYGHRVRIATHSVFEELVTSSNLEFFPIGGDPEELMAYMVKNPGLIPNMKSLRSGDVLAKRRMVAQILEGCWQSCISPHPTDGVPFAADAIIANPPSFAHVHCAQALGVPLHLMFTMPWSPTRMFPHPLANLRVSNSGGIGNKQHANWISFAVVEWMTWQGLGDLINGFRQTLDLEPVPTSEGPLLHETPKIPFTYCWSQALVPKPFDWGSHIDICGFFFRNAPSYSPDEELVRFLQNGPTPIYVGFGSIVIEDPEKMTQMILQAVQAAGVRAIISRGWSKLGGARTNDKSIYYLGDCPHEWLFQHVHAVVHHGGAGTMACGLRFARPTVIVPFFGDQPFWGEVLSASGAGPPPIPYREMTSEKLSEAIRFCFRDSTFDAARTIAEKMHSEAGVQVAARSFHRHLPLQNMRCRILSDQPATFKYKSSGQEILLSSLATAVLVTHRKLNMSHLKINDSRPVIIENVRWEPVTATISAVFSTYANMATSATDIVARPVKAYRAASSRATSSNVDLNSTSSQSGRNEGDAPVSEHSLDSPQPVYGPVAMGVVSGVGKFLSSFGKGFLIDMPLALSEGLRNTPKLYGGEVPDYGPVTGWKSGFIVSGKNFAQGVGGGMVSLIVEPVKGGREEGALGVLKGTGKGLVGLGTKIASGALGVVAYPGLGIYRSLHRATYTTTRDQIIAARREAGLALWANAHDQSLQDRVLAAFDELRSRKWPR